MSRSALALGAVLVLSACAVETGTLRLFPAEPGASVAAATTDDESTAAMRAPRATGDAALLAAGAEGPAYVAVDADPERLIGLSVGQASELLGRPALVRAEPPAEIWQYAGAECVLHLFLYESEMSGALAVTYYEMRGLDGISPQACLAAHLEAGARGG